MTEPNTRLRLARSRVKARKQLRELLDDPTLIESLVIARTRDDKWAILIGGMPGPRIAQALMMGAQALEHVAAHEDKIDGGNGPVRLDVSATTGPVGEATGRKRVPEVTTDREGNLVPPKGETWIACAECGCRRWYVTVCDDGTPGRDCCVRCGNEIKSLPIYHQEGQA